MLARLPFLLALLGLAPACDEGAPVGEDPPLCQGAKCDAAHGAGPCPSTAAMIEAARQVHLTQIYARSKFDDLIAGVDPLGDLDGDGVGDALVRPGLQYAGDRVEFSVYLSQGGSCPEYYAGHFDGDEAVAAPEGSAHGVSDILGTIVDPWCDAQQTRYRYNGRRYRRFDESMERVCDPTECRSDRRMVLLARRALSAVDPERFDQLEWNEHDDEMFVHPTRDLDGDGTGDYFVFPGATYSTSSAEVVIMLSRGWSCADRYAGHASVTDIAVADDGAASPDGVLDLVATNVTGCTTVTTRLVFDGDVFVEGAWEESSKC